MEFNQRAEAFIADAYENYDWSRDHQELITEIARTITVMDWLEAQITPDMPVMVGSASTLKINPIITAVESHRRTLATLLKALGIADIDREEADKEAAQASGNVIAPHRWNVNTGRQAGKASGRARK